MRILIDDINHTVQVYQYYDVDGQQVEASKTYVRRNPVVSTDGAKVTINNHPRVGGRLHVTVDGEVFTETVDQYQGAQDVLAKIASRITLDDTDRTAEIGTGEDDVYELTIHGATIEDVRAEDFDHEPLPPHVESALHRHIAGY